MAPAMLTSSASGALPLFNEILILTEGVVKEIVSDDEGMALTESDQARNARERRNRRCRIRRHHVLGAADPTQNISRDEETKEDKTPELAELRRQRNQNRRDRREE